MVRSEDGATQHCKPESGECFKRCRRKSLFRLHAPRQHLHFSEWAGAAYCLFISKDQIGAPLGESRPWGKPGCRIRLTWNSNGASFPNGASIAFAGWDATDGTKFTASASYNNGATLLLVSGQYDSTKAGCNPPYKTWAGAQQYVGAFSFAAESCFTYMNLTNPSANPAMDLRSQIVRAYAVSNPGFDLSGFNIGEVVVTGGYARACLGATGGSDRTSQSAGRSMQPAEACCRCSTASRNIRDAGDTCTDQCMRSGNIMH